MGKSRRNAIDIEAELGGGYLVSGFVTGLTSEIATDRFIAPVVEYAHDQMARAFDEEADAIARSGGDNLSHVYEWRMNGVPAGRLWQHTLAGRGTQRQASWKWLPSKTPILKPEERKDIAGDPMQGVDDDDIAQLSNRDYYFTWKAPVNEYGLPVNIIATNAKALFIPSNTAENGFYFAKSSGRQTLNKNAGRFTAMWVSFWGDNGAGAVWDMHIKNAIEKDLARSEKELGKAGRGKRRKKSFTISTITDNNAAFEAGRNYAEAYVKGRAKSYKQASRYLDRYGKYGNEVNYPT